MNEYTTFLQLVFAHIIRFILWSGIVIEVRSFLYKLNVNN